jgi:hypothetical protein
MWYLGRKDKHELFKQVMAFNEKLRAMYHVQYDSASVSININHQNIKCKIIIPNEQ